MLLIGGVIVAGATLYAYSKRTQKNPLDELYNTLTNTASGFTDSLGAVGPAGPLGPSGNVFGPAQSFLSPLTDFLFQPTAPIIDSGVKFFTQPKTSNSNIPVAQVQAPQTLQTYSLTPRFGGGSVLTSQGSYYNTSGKKIPAPIGTPANPAKITAQQLAVQTIGGGTKAKPKVVNLFDFASRAGG